MNNYTFIFCLSIAFIAPVEAQKIATFEVEIPVTARGWGIPVSVSLDSITNLGDTVLVLSDITNGKINAPIVDCQVSKIGNSRILNWLIQNGRANDKRTFELARARPIVSNPPLKALKVDSSVILQTEDKTLVRYYSKEVLPPDSIDQSYRRSGFIHPLRTPNGQVLTRIQPADHYHHYGIWNAWTHVLFENDTIDFWNLRDKKGLVRFAKFNSITEGRVFSEFEALQEHVVVKGKVKVALNEVQTVRVFRPSADCYIMDITLNMACASESPFKILEYRYAGQGWRATEEWTNANSEVLTSEGKTRKNGDGTKARWWLAQGKLGSDYGGAVVMSHPSNFNHPEPLRIWPENQYDRGDFFGMFAPTKDKDWLLEPKKNYTLRYRWMVFSGTMTAAKAEAAWQVFGAAPKVTVVK